MGFLTKSRIFVQGLNGEFKTINDTPINRIIVAGDYSYDKKSEQLIFEYNGYSGNIGPKICILYRPNTNKTETDSISGCRGRQLRISKESTSINLSRLYALCKELSLNRLTLAEVDNFVLNHKNNNGLDEALFESNEGLEVDNYELVSQSENKIHGDAWNRAHEIFRLDLKFSAKDQVMISIINMSGDRRQFLLHCRVQELDFKKYGIR